MKTIQLKYISRIEGECALDIKYRGQEVTEVQLKVFEPPRFFESFLRGRKYSEVPDITSRICGICPIAYQMSSIHAIENAARITMQGPLRDLRRLAYCGEWIESHTLHIYMLQAPDFLGFNNVIDMAAQYPNEVQRGLRLKKIGNELFSLLGGREIHPINYRIGGFYRAPHPHELMKLRNSLQWARDAALETVQWVSQFDFPSFEQNYEFVSLHHPLEYPMNEGRIISNLGLNIPIDEFENHFTEFQNPYSNALQSVHSGYGPYLVGALSRFNLCFDQFSPLVKQAAHQVGFTPLCNNPFKSIIARSLEVLYACDEALRIIETYQLPNQPTVDFSFQWDTNNTVTGYGCTEAPRGILFHRYVIDSHELIQESKIIPPTSQNQLMIETDLKNFIQSHLPSSRTKLESLCEKLVRTYDPCISCSTHFLKFNWKDETAS